MELGYADLFMATGKHPMVGKLTILNHLRVEVEIIWIIFVRSNGKTMLADKMMVACFV